MEAHAGGDIEVEIGVVHAVQPPERGHRVEQHVLKVDGKIEHDHCGDDAEPYGHIQDVKESPAVLLGE